MYLISNFQNIKIDVIRVLMENGASIDAQSEQGFTPIYMAAQEGHEDIVNYLLENGADQNLTMDEGFCPIDIAMQQGHDNIVSILIEHEQIDIKPD